MKELSIEEKAKRYDEAYKVAKNIHIFSSDLAEIKRMEEIFPELKEESEGERIRKRICKLLWDNAPYEEAQEYIAWLEKQGNPTEDELEALRMAAYKPTKNWSEKLQSLYKKLTHCEQKPVIEMKSAEESLGIDSDTYNKIVDECIYGEQKLANKIEPKDYSSIDPHFFKTTDNVEPKFHEGDWITNDDYTWKIVEVKPLDYILQSQDGNIIVDTISYVDEQFHSFTIQDAKPGDVFVNQNGEMPFIFKECKNNHIYCYCGYTNRKDIFFDRFVDSEGEELHWLNLYHEQAYPAIKEQRDTLFAKMKEAGYEWDAKKKELKKIEQKPAWSEEDETKIKSIIALLKSPALCTMDGNKGIIDESIKYLKSLKDRVQPQLQQGWTEEDERIIKRIKSLLYAINENDFEDIYAWLKFLKDRVQPKQEWSKEDEVKINRIVACLENLNVADNDILLKDVDWLKSLKERVENEKDKHQ